MGMTEIRLHPFAKCGGGIAILIRGDRLDDALGLPATLADQEFMVHIEAESWVFHTKHLIPTNEAYLVYTTHCTEKTVQGTLFE